MVLNDAVQDESKDGSSCLEVFPNSSIAKNLVPHMFDQAEKHVKNFNQAVTYTMPSTTLSITASPTCANTFKPGLSPAFPSTMSPLKDRKSFGSQSLEEGGKYFYSIVSSTLTNKRNIRA